MAASDTTSDTEPFARLISYDGFDATVCPECCETYGWADVGCPIYPINVLPYRAVCHECDRELLKGRSTPSWPVLFGPESEAGHG